MHRFIIAVALTLCAVPTIASAQPHGDRDRGDRPSSKRELWQLQQELDEKLDALDALQDRQLVLLDGNLRGHERRELKEIVRRTKDITRDLKDIRSDMRTAIRGLGYERERPRPEPVPVRRVPAPLSADRFDFVYRSIDEATFPDHQLNAIRDALNTGAFFGIGQARRILELFPHETHRVQAGVLLCPHIVEDGALPYLLQTFTFENYKQELRTRTNNVCGWQP